MSRLVILLLLISSIFLGSCQLREEAVISGLYTPSPTIISSSVISSVIVITPTQVLQSLPSCSPPDTTPQLNRDITLSRMMTNAKNSGNLPEVGFMSDAQISYDHQKLIFRWRENTTSPGNSMVYNDIDGTVSTLLELDEGSFDVGPYASPVSDCILVEVFLEETPDVPYLMLDSQGNQYLFNHEIPGLDPDFIRGRSFAWALDGVHMVTLVTKFLEPNGSYDDPTTSSLYLTRVDGSLVKPLFLDMPKDEFTLWDLAWSPDHQQLASIAIHHSDKPYTEHLMLINIETTERHEIFIKDGLSRIIWSSDGKSIYYKADKEECYRIVLATEEITPVELELCDRPLPPGTNP